MQIVRDTLDFSVVIPTRDRHAQLAECLDAVSRLRFPPSRFEVVVVDDGSRVPLEPVVAPYRDRLRLTLVTQSPGGPALARNCGAAAAKGRFLAFTDDDCRPGPDWLDRLAAGLETFPDAVSGGPTINALECNTYATASQTLISYLYDYFNSDPAKHWFLASSNLALAAECFRSVGGFDLSYPTAAAEDRDLCDRLRAGGHTMLYAPDAVVFHSHPLGLVSFWSQHFEYGRGARRYWRAHRQRSGERMRVEPLGFYWGLLAYPMRQKQVRNPLAVVGLLLISQVANAAGYLREWTS